MTDLSKQKQAFRHDPKNGIYGDCSRTVIACMLKMPRDDVPHDHSPDDKELSMVAREDAWLKSKGFVRIAIPVVGYMPLEDVFKCGNAWGGGRDFVLMGKSRNGTNHVVIANGKGIVWDPAIDDSGIVAPCDEGFYWIEFILKEIDNV